MAEERLEKAYNFIADRIGYDMFIDNIIYWIDEQDYDFNGTRKALKELLDGCSFTSEEWDMLAKWITNKAS